MNERDLFMAALPIEDPARRRDYLDEACGGDSGLRRRVGALLLAFEQAGSFLQQPPNAASTSDQPTAGPSGDESEGVGTVIGPYKLLEQIGEGGMGTVYRAEQTEPVRRVVALKVIKPGMDSRQVIARLNAERQALALMDHPHIAKVLDAGATETGRPYFVMELVEGTPITRYCDEHRLTPRERLELFVPVCQAVQHAHTKGIIHRDLKPSNVLVGPYDGKPVPKVIDFGVAKAMGQQITEATLLTGFGAVIGTLEYMSPEQAQLDNVDIDTRSNIYSLGVVLYELLTGTTPLPHERVKEAAILEVLRLVREEEPPRPSTRLSSTEGLPRIAANRGLGPRTLTGLAHGDLDWIVMKALEKDCKRRYETASAFSADVQRYLVDEPVQACPPSAWYRLPKFARRNKGTLAAAFAAGIVALIGLGIVSAVQTKARNDLDRKNGELTQANADLDLQRRRAEANETQAIDAVKKFGDAIAEEPLLKDTLVLKDLRNRLLQGPLTFFRGLRERLQADRDTRPEALVRLAEAVHKYAHLTDEIGDTQDGLKAHEDSLAIWEGLTRDDPENPEYQSGSAWIHNCRGRFLSDTGQPGEARRAIESALAIRRKLAEDHPTVTLYQRDPAASHQSLGLLLSETGRPAEARRSYESALAIGRKLAEDHPEAPDFASNLGGTLNDWALIDLDEQHFAKAREDLQEAITWQKNALAANPRNPQYRQFLANHLTNLIKAAQGLGRDDEAAGAKRELAELQASDPRFEALDARLSAVLNGEAPKDNAERLALARRAYDTKKYAAAAKLWAEALESDPRVSADRQKQHPYNAACAAAKAADGQGVDNPRPDDVAKAKLREQALAWLQSELATWSKFVESGPPQAKAFIAQTLEHWQKDTDLAGIREPEALEGLPGPERDAWRALWEEVSKLLGKARAGE
jgi:serine/threonine protein kinase